MKSLFTSVIISLLLSAVSASHAQTLCETVRGATIIAEDGESIGVIENKYESDSILNEYGQFGSEYSDKSIWNEYGTYGGKYSSMSPFNEYTSTPPILVKDGNSIAYLTVSKTLEPAVNPFVLKTCEY